MAKGLPISGCSSNGDISWQSLPTKDQLTQAQDVLHFHDRTKAPPGESKLDELRAKRRLGENLSAEDIQSLLDIILGV